MNFSMSTSEDDIGKYFYKRVNQRINFLPIKFGEKPLIILPQGTH
jgi:hypothetical protein